MAGPVGIGGANPVRIQSMTTSDTQNVAATVRQCIALAEVGCEIIRVTAPNVPAAKCLRDIRAGLSAAGFANIPLVADIHFLPAAAMEAVEHVEKVRVNPGNYADKKKFAVKEYTDADYQAEMERLHEAFTPLVLRAKALGRCLRIGTNHGSLSDRIMNRFGDSALGMVESALEFVRIAESHGFHGLVLSMKSSNPKVVIQAYRLLVERMDAAHHPYPLHLGVTEAGDGEDGRIKSAIGIGSLLLDGLGDTIRVSLTEDSVYEIPVARAIADKAMTLWARAEAGPEAAPHPLPDGIDPYHFVRRETTSLTLSSRCTVGPEQPPRVIVRAESAAKLDDTLRRLGSPALKDTPAEGVLVAIESEADLAAAVDAVTAQPAAVDFLALELPPALKAAVLETQLARLKSRTVLLRHFAFGEQAAFELLLGLARRTGHYLAAEIDPADFAGYLPLLRHLGDASLLFTLSAVNPDVAGHPTGAYRALLAQLHACSSRAPVWIRNTAGTAIRPEPAFLSRLLEASFLTGGLLCDGVGDLVSLETEADPVRAAKVAYNVLQGAGARNSKTEFVACPSCGRTLFDLQTTTQRIRAQTGHLKGVKLAIMGCIVNGPGEMADADFGYVGGAPGKINLYVGKTCVQYNIPQEEADARLIALIREHGKWVDPDPATAAG
jgi:(E)-4-hydroxy-3-methylbut-2-enyl-diphosphate synthase